MYDNSVNSRMRDLYKDNFTANPTVGRKFANPYFIPTSNQLLFSILNKTSKVPTSTVAPLPLAPTTASTAVRSGSNEPVEVRKPSKTSQLINKLAKLKQQPTADDRELIKKRMAIIKAKEDIAKQKKVVPKVPSVGTVESRPAKPAKAPVKPAKAPAKAPVKPAKPSKTPKPTVKPTSKDGLKYSGIWALPPTLTGDTANRIKQLKAWKLASKKATESPALGSIPSDVNDKYTKANQELLKLERQQKDALYVPITKMPSTLADVKRDIKNSEATRPYSNPRLTDGQQSKTWKSWKRENTQLKDILKKLQKKPDKTASASPIEKPVASKAKTFDKSMPDFLGMEIEGQLDRDDILTTSGKGRGGFNKYAGLTLPQSKKYGEALEARSKAFTAFKALKADLADKSVNVARTAKQRAQFNKQSGKALKKAQMAYMTANQKVNKGNKQSFDKGTENPFGRAQGTATNLRGGN